MQGAIINTTNENSSSSSVSSLPTVIITTTTTTTTTVSTTTTTEMTSFPMTKSDELSLPTTTSAMIEEYLSDGVDQVNPDEEEYK